MEVFAPQVHSLHDPATGTLTHIVYEKPGSACAIVDPVLDFDVKSGRTRTTSAEKVAAFVREQGLRVEWILETHAHADHLSGAPWLREQLGGRIAIGRDITRVQSVFKELFNLEPGFPTDGRQFDELFAEGDAFAIGALQARVVAMPGHTPACVAYQVGDAVFVGDTMFAPDIGTARCDFPGGCATQLYRSIRRVLELPPATRLFLCHDYPPAGRGPLAMVTVAQQRAANVHVRDGVSEAEFVAMRTARDAKLDMPQLILPSVQVNIRAGQLPPREGNGVAYLKIPLNAL